MKSIQSLILAAITIGLISCGNSHVQEKSSDSDTTKLENTTSSGENQPLEKGAKLDTEPKTDLEYQIYCNQRFDYCIDYPKSILFPQGESDNGDGQVFKSKDAENTLWVYRDSRNYINPDEPYSLEDAFNEDSRGNNPDHPKKVITYKKLGDTYFVVSGYNEGRVFYQKTISKEGDFVTFMLEYKESDKSIYDEIASRISRTFK